MFVIFFVVTLPTQKTYITSLVKYICKYRFYMPLRCILQKHHIHLTTRPLHFEKSKILPNRGCYLF